MACCSSATSDCEEVERLDAMLWFCAVEDEMLGLWETWGVDGAEGRGEAKEEDEGDGTSLRPNTVTKCSVTTRG